MTKLKEKPGLSLAADPGNDEMTENHPLSAFNYTPPPENVNDQIFRVRYLDELKRLEFQADRMDQPLLALEIALLRAQHVAATLRAELS